MVFRSHFFPNNLGDHVFPEGEGSSHDCGWQNIGGEATGQCRLAVIYKDLSLNRELTD